MLSTLQTESKVLRTTLAFEKVINHQLNKLEHDNKLLSQFVEFRDTTAKQDPVLSRYTYRIAQVIPNEDSSKNVPGTVTINLGEQDGMAPNMSVITSTGILLGITREVASTHTTVSTLSANFPKGISVTIKGQNSFGTIETFGEGTMKVEKIPVDDPAAVGQQYVTSGLGQQFPEGLILGKAVSIDQGDFGISKVATIQYEGFTPGNMQYVFVVDASEAKAE